MTKRVFLSVVLAALTASCGRQDRTSEAFAEPAAVSTPGGDVFEVDAFGMTVTKPQGWFAMNASEAQQLMEAGGAVTSAGNAQLEAVIENSKARTRNLFGFFEHEIGAPVDINPSVIAVAEDVRMAPGVKTGKDYFFHSRKLMQQSSVGYEIKDEYGVRSIGGVSFDRMDLMLTMNGVAVPQSYYAARRGDYILVFIETYSPEGDRAATGAVIDSIRFE